MLHRFRFVIMGVVIVLASAAASYAAVSAAMPNALLPAGTTRYATVYASDFRTINTADGWVDMPGMIKYITIPTGQTADVIVIFCGTGGVNVASGWLNTRATIRDVVAAPTTFLLTDLVGGTSNCGIFQKSNVTAGSPAVKIQWSVDPSAGSAEIISRHMFVIANIH